MEHQPGAIDIYEKLKFPPTPPYPDPVAPYYVTDPAILCPIVKAPFGWGAWEPQTVMQFLATTVEKYGNGVYMRWKANQKAEFVDITWKEFDVLARQAAKSFIALGLEPHYGVSIMGFNSPEWVIAHMGAIMAGGISAGIYSKYGWWIIKYLPPATNNPEACHWIADSSRSQVVLVETAEYLERIVGIRDRLKHCKALVQWRGEPQEENNIFGWKSFLKLGESVADEVLQERIDKQKPSQCCSLIYTSGTQGNPKGVMLSHDNCTWEARAVMEGIGMRHKQRMVSYLPMSHIAAQLLDIYMAMYGGSTIAFCQPDALKGTLVLTIKETEPTMFFGVPRVWEKFMEKMKAKGKSNGAITKYLVSWAKTIGEWGHANMAEDLPLPWGWTLAEMLIFGKVRNALGFNKCNAFGTASAPIPYEVHKFFRELNMPIQEGYGASETTGICTLSIPPYRGAIPTVGMNLPGCAVKLVDLDKDGNGEIMVRGRNRFMGYLFDEEATKATIEPNGFYHSGDVGKYDERGYLTITGRIKEILITAGGENVAPILTEANVKEELGEIVADVMLIGDGKKYLSLLLTLKSEISPEGKPLLALDPDAQKVIAKIVGEDLETVAQALKNAKILEYVQHGIDAANKKAISRVATIRKWCFLPTAFSLAGGELTPTMKLKRRVVMEKYKESIEELYLEK